ERRQRAGVPADPLRDVLDHAALQVDAERVAGLGAVGGTGAGHDGQAHVDRVAVEDTSEAGRNDARDAGALDGDGGMLAGRARPKVGPADDPVPGPPAGTNLWVGFFPPLL